MKNFKMPSSLQEGRNLTKLMEDHAKYVRGEITYEQLHSKIGNSMTDLVKNEYTLEDLITPEQVDQNIMKNKNKNLTEEDMSNIKNKVQRIIECMNDGLKSLQYSNSIHHSFDTCSGYYDTTTPNQYFEEELKKAIQQFVDAGWCVSYKIKSSYHIVSIEIKPNKPCLYERIFKNGWKHVYRH